MAEYVRKLDLEKDFEKLPIVHIAGSKGRAQHTVSFSFLGSGFALSVFCHLVIH